jgi:hypothetical protein
MALREGGKGESSRTPAAAVELRSTKKRAISLSLPSPTAGDCRAAAPRVNPRAQRPRSLWEKVGLFRHVMVCQVPLDRSVRPLDTKADAARLHTRAPIVAASARSRFLPPRAIARGGVFHVNSVRADFLCDGAGALSRTPPAAVDHPRCVGVNGDHLASIARTTHGRAGVAPWQSRISFRADAGSLQELQACDDASPAGRECTHRCAAVPPLQSSRKRRC